MHFTPIYLSKHVSLYFFLAAVARKWVQREPWECGLQGQSVAGGPAGRGQHTFGERPSRERNHTGGSRGVDRVSAADSGLQFHRPRAMERRGEGSHARIRWGHATHLHLRLMLMRVDRSYASMAQFQMEPREKQKHICHLCRRGSVFPFPFSG